MPQNLPRPDPPDRPVFENWIAERDACAGFRRCLADGICPFCEQHTLVFVASPDGILLSCPCLF